MSALVSVALAAASATANVDHGSVVRVGANINAIRYYSTGALEDDRIRYASLDDNTTNAVEQFLRGLMRIKGAELKNPPKVFHVSEGRFPKSGEPGFLQEGEIDVETAVKQFSLCEAWGPRSLGAEKGVSYAVVDFKCPRFVDRWKGFVVGFSIKDGKVIDLDINFGDLPSYMPEKS